MTDDTRQLVEALHRKVIDLEGRVDELEQDKADLWELVDPDPGGVSYDQLTKDQKVHRVRKKLLTKATGPGTPAMKYKDVMWLFDGHPSAGHCYDLMERAAELDGFHYETSGGGRGEKRIRVDVDSVNDETLLHAVNNAPSQNPA